MAQLDLKATKVVTIKNESKEPVAFRYFRVNFVETIEADDEVVLTALSSEEAAYYKALEDAKIGLKVTLTDAE